MQNKQSLSSLDKKNQLTSLTNFFKKDFGIWWTLLLLPIYSIFILHIITGEFDNEKQSFNQFKQAIQEQGKEKTLEHLGLIFSLENKPEHKITHTDTIPQWKHQSRNRFKNNFSILHMGEGQTQGVTIDDFYLPTDLDTIASKNQYKKFRVKCLIKREQSTLNSRCHFFPKSPWHDPEYKGVRPKDMPQKVSNKFIVNAIIDYKFSEPKIVSIELKNSYVDTTQKTLLVPEYKFSESPLFRIIYFIILSIVFTIIGFRPFNLMKNSASFIKSFPGSLANRETNSSYEKLPKIHSEILKKKD